MRTDLLPQKPRSQPQKHVLRPRAADLTGNQHLGARGPLRIGQLAVLFLDQVPPQGDHEQHAQQPADQGMGRTARSL